MSKLTVLKTLCRVFLLIINLLFSFLGLSLFIVGLVMRYSESVTRVLLDTAGYKLQEAIKATGIDSNPNIDLDMVAFLKSAAIGVILAGFFLLCLASYGVCVAVYKWRKPTILYVLLCLSLLLGEIIAIVVVYASDSVHDSVKSHLRRVTKENYAGFSGSDVTTVLWNVAMIQGQCCGVDNYQDFQNCNNWHLTETAAGQTVTVMMPLSCCNRLPSTNDLSCAQVLLNTKNNYDKGCYERYWNWTIGNPSIAAVVLPVVGVLHLTLITAAAVLLFGDRSAGDNRVSPYDAVHNSRFRVAPKGRQSLSVPLSAASLPEPLAPPE